MGLVNAVVPLEQLEEEGWKWAQEILDKLVFAEPGNQAAKDLLADVFEQIGYQQESPSVRNSFIAAALEAGCARLLTEDLEDGQVIETVTVTNPFAKT